MTKRTLKKRIAKYRHLKDWGMLVKVLFGMASIFFFVIFNKNKINQLQKKINKPIWLFCERGDDAKDNGYVLYKYIRENCPEIAAYYIMNSESSHTIGYKKVNAIGNIIHANTREHKLYFAAANILAETHSFIWITPWNFVAYEKISKLFTTKKEQIFLQHGITKDARADELGNNNNNFDIFICGAKPEYDYILENFGFDASVVKYTGFSRYDNLYNIKTKKQILFMPTWRSFIMDNEKITEKEFIKTQYYKTYQNFINNTYLQQLLYDNGLELIFYPHINMQQFVHKFTTQSKKIIIANKENYDVQTLLKESKLLITDYSSVFFDFAYMQKPMIFYQFDEKEFFDKHYKKGYFNYRRDGFGEVVMQENELIENIQKVIENNFEMEEKYEKRIDGFFPLHDQKNCERIVDIIKALG